MASVGEAAYLWHIGTDALTWAQNAPAVLGLRDTKIIGTGRAFASLLDPGNAQTRFDAVMRTQKRDEGNGVPYLAQYCLAANPRSAKLWIEDIGRWFAGPDGRPQRAQGIIRVINDRYEREQQLAYLSRFDALTGEFNRWHLTERLNETLQESIRARTSCGFLLVAVDNLARVNEAYGYEVADEVIAAVAKRMRTRMRQQDCLGRFSGNKFGLILKDCTPEDLTIAADRLLAGIRDDVVMTAAGPVAVTATIGGVTAPATLTTSTRFSRACRKHLMEPRQSAAAPSSPTGPIRSAKRSARKTCDRPTRSWRRSTSGASCWPSSRWRAHGRVKPLSTNA